MSGKGGRHGTELPVVMQRKRWSSCGGIYIVFVLPQQAEIMPEKEFKMIIRCIPEQLKFFNVDKYKKMYLKCGVFKN